MREATRLDLADMRWPRLWRMFLTGLCALILCSCRSPGSVVYDTSTLDSTTAGPWAPPGFSQPWPQDEYLHDGGDRGLPAKVRTNWEVLGLELEDTIAHYDTEDGQTVVEPSNRVHIYSPRFGAVRQVSTLMSNRLAKRAGGVHLPEQLADPTTLQIVTSSQQHLQTDRQIGTKQAIGLRSKQGDGILATTNKANGLHQDVFLPYENLRIIRYGIFESAEMAYLAKGSTAAIAWSHNQAVQVILDHQAAMAEVKDQLAASVHTVKDVPGKSKLRVVKVASTQFAEPGDEVALTIRFDNVGQKRIGNVTIIDNLTTRLEYVADSAECSIAAEFFTQPNEGDSLVIRCEVTDPLEPGQGGILRFRCRVR